MAKGRTIRKVMGVEGGGGEFLSSMNLFFFNVSLE